MNNFDAFRPITRRHFWDDYRSPLTCVAFPTFSASASGETMDLGIDPVLQADGPVALTATRVGADVSLTWSPVAEAYAFVIYRGPSAVGPFTIQASGVIGETFLDPAVPGTTLFYRVTAIEPRFGETLPSPTVSV